MTATLRVRETQNTDYDSALRTAFTYLFQTYGEGFFDVSVTCNAILQSNVNQKFSCWFGQDFGGREYNLGPPTTVRDLGDVSNIDTNVTVDDFAEVFHAIHSDTEVSVIGIINVIFIITKYMENYEREKTTGARLVILY